MTQNPNGCADRMGLPTPVQRRGVGVAEGGRDTDYNGTVRQYADGELLAQARSLHLRSSERHAFIRH